MSRVFVGVGSGTGECDVYVEQNGARLRLTRTGQRAHKGYSWDQAGPRSTELARAMLWLVTGAEPPGRSTGASQAMWSRISLYLRPHTRATAGVSQKTRSEHGCMMWGGLPRTPAPRVSATNATWQWSDNQGRKC
ncbi:MAG TPA: hypothetical protein VEW94_03015 [Chloroflexia bacterium]|nr:hypothetical protein [Chloroflexia bacterium]